MPFRLFGKRKKYPFSKQKSDPPMAVYAGPEYFARRAGREGKEAVLDVYAGPEFFEDTPLPPEDGVHFPTVYAGPEPPRAEKPVYAGPEFFEKGTTPEALEGAFPEEDAPLPPEDGEA